MTKENSRRINKVWKSAPMRDGAGVSLRRAFGFHEIPQLDPFLLLDAFRTDNPEDYLKGFPFHPHRGMETITYILDGDVEHKDILGNAGVISSGDAQWMTAGSGIVHQEMPKGDAKGRMWGFQLWANLPAADKMMDPRYQEVKSRAIPQVKTKDGALVRVIAGSVDGVEGPVKGIVTDPEFLDVSLPSAKVFHHDVPAGHTVFAYVVEGRARFDQDPRGQELETDTVILYGPGSSVSVTTENRPARFLLVSGKPIGEPIAWYGPVVMNTEAELKTAYEELGRGTFMRVRAGP